MAFFNLGEANTQIPMDDLVTCYYVTSEGRLNDLPAPLGEKELIVCRLHTTRGMWVFGMESFQESLTLWQAFTHRDGYFQGAWFVGRVRDLATDTALTTITDIMMF